MDELTKLAKRRASNRQSQQKARDAKEAELNTLRAENERLRSLYASFFTYSPLSSARTHTVHSPGLSAASAHKALDLKACRQAFLAVLASVCDPHLNTIHAVCAQFALARGSGVEIQPLNPPRPPNRPLNVDCPSSMNNIDFAHEVDFSNLTPKSMYIPDQHSCGPLSIPGLEPLHPVAGHEIDASQAWQVVLELVDMSQVDAEELATRVAEKVRCYGFDSALC